MDISRLIEPPEESTSPSPAQKYRTTSAPSTSEQQLSPHPAESPAKSKWSAEEDALIIELRGCGMKWEDISKRLPGRSAISCRLHYQNYLERSDWDEEQKTKLALAYYKFKSDMWSKVAKEMGIPWRAAEAMHWQLGEVDMARRVGTVPFSLSPHERSEQPLPRHVDSVPTSNVSTHDYRPTPANIE